MAEYFTKDGDDFVKVDDNLFTQEDIDTKILPKRLERERSKFADYDTLKEKAGKVDTIASEFETKLAEKDTAAQELQAQLKKTQLEVDKVKIVHEFKLSDELSEFVTGETPDEMRQRAEKLAKGFKGGTPPINKNRKPEGNDSDSKSLARNLFGGKKSDD